jgi:hypothetical protein
MKKFFITACAAAVVTMLFTGLPFAQVSQTPPMGWNSYDSKNFSVTEAEVKSTADTMAAKYAKYGWQYICVDWCWSFPGMGTQATPDQTFSGGAPTAATRLHMDAWGRLMPDTVRHPSSVGGAGFGPLAAYVHGKGLKFGIHVMRGIPRQAVMANTPIYGSTYTAATAASLTDTCSWLNQMYGLNFGSPAAQAYLTSILSLYASWGVDFIKIDDMLNSLVTPRTTWKTYVEAYRATIDSSGRPMVFSTSPGATPIGDSVFYETYANQWRMADDLWDNWANVDTMLSHFVQWYRCAAPGHFPDADMIPIGKLSERGPNGSPRWSNLPRNQQYLLMTMWCIGRSPLIWGGDLDSNRPAEDSLMTNPEVIATNQNGTNSRPLTATGTMLAWASDNPDTAYIKWVALVNRSTSSVTPNVDLNALGVPNCVARNLWTRTNLTGTFASAFSQTIAAQSAGLYKLTALPGVPVLSSPTNSATLQPVSPSLSWGTATFAAAYGVEVSTSSTFGTTVFSQAGLTSPTAVVAGLSSSRLYYWQVNASNVGGGGAWSAAWSFGTGTGTSVLTGAKAAASTAFSVNGQTLAYSLQGPCLVEMSFSDLLGKTALAINRMQSAGRYTVDLKGTLAAGQYIVHFRAAGVERRALVVIAR